MPGSGEILVGSLNLFDANKPAREGQQDFETEILSVTCHP